MTIQIDVTRIAERMIDSLQLTEEEWKELEDDGRVVVGWSDTLLDNMARVYDLEGEVINEMVRLHQESVSAEAEKEDDEPSR